MPKTLPDIPNDVLDRGRDCAEFYLDLLERGESQRIAEMLALQAAPRCVTDDTFFAGKKNGQQFAKDEATGNAYAQELRAKGVSTAGKTYMHSLAKYPGDPEAWVSSRSEAVALIKKRGWSCDGQIKVKRNKDCLGEEPEYGVADDIIDDEVYLTLHNNPELGRTADQRERLRAELLDKRMPHWAKGNTKKPKRKKPLISIGKGE